MAITPLKYKPGVCKSNSSYSDKLEGGRFTDMDKVRFDAGYPEGIFNYVGNAIPLVDATSISDIDGSLAPKGSKVFRDNSGNKYVAYGTVSHLFYFTITAIDPTSAVPFTTGTVTDITPLRSILSSTLTNPFDMVSGSATVTVHHTAHGLSTGDYVQLVTTTSFGGLTIAGVFAPITISDANTYTIVNTSAATGSVNTGGGTVTYNYFRITISNPFDTTISTPTVSVNHTAHGAAAGDYVTISGASAVGGITPSGEYKIQTITNANKYTITHGSNATSSVSAGGGTPNFRYNIATGISTRIWCLDNYGQQLLANPYLGTIYIWDPTVGGRAYPMYNAPTGVLAMFVTPERFVFALGKTSFAMTVSWPDQTDYTAWTPTATNTANSRTLQEGSFLVGGIVARDGVSLVFTNSACYTFSYRGDEFIYADAISGVKCGLPGPLAVAAMEGIPYWFSGTDFWCWNGSVQRLDANDIRDYVVSDFYTPNARLCVVGSHVAKNEIWFHYPSTADAVAGTNSNTNGKYVIFFPDQQCWANGTFRITSWADSGLLPCPIFSAWGGTAINFSQFCSLDYGTGMGGQVVDATGTSYIKFSPMNISNGEQNMEILGFIPDFQLLDGAGSGNGINVSIIVQNYPQDAETTVSTVLIPDNSVVSPIGLRTGAKLVGYKLQSSVIASNIQWRLGLPRIEVQAGGSRR